MPFDFSGKKVLVTGAAGGIGAPLTRSIVNAGGFVYALGRRNNVEELAKENDNIHPIIVDLADWEATRTTLESLEPLDGVVNMAMLWEGPCEAMKMADDRLKKSLTVNLMAPINVIQVTAKKMINAGKIGSIVNVSSVFGISAARGCLDYGCTKAGLDMVTKQFALELGPHNIRVNSVNPTFVSTETVMKLMKDTPDLYERFISITPIGRLCEVKEAIEPILYLLSDHSSMVTGTAHVVDGGHLSSIPV